jgi:hypothetical protein
MTAHSWFNMRTKPKKCIRRCMDLLHYRRFEPPTCFDHLLIPSSGSCFWNDILQRISKPIYRYKTLFFFQCCTVHLDTIKSYLLSDGCTIKYSKKNVKIYININIKSASIYYGPKRPSSGSVAFVLAKVIIINL